MIFSNQGYLMNGNIPFLDWFSANGTLPVLKDVLENIVIKGVCEHLIKSSLKCELKKSKRFVLKILPNFEVVVTWGWKLCRALRQSEFQSKFDCREEIEPSPLLFSNTHLC